MDIEFDFKGDPLGGVITKCKLTFYVVLPQTSVYYYTYTVRPQLSLDQAVWRIKSQKYNVNESRMVKYYSDQIQSHVKYIH